MAPPVPYRKTFAFPKTDESTAGWWDAQADPSLSVKLLIRAEIERHGYTDTANRPVRQLPRRGRPPKDEYEDADHDAEEPESESARQQQKPQSAPAAQDDEDDEPASGMDDILNQLGNN